MSDVCEIVRRMFGGGTRNDRKAVYDDVMRGKCQSKRLLSIKSGSIGTVLGQLSIVLLFIISERIGLRR